MDHITICSITPYPTDEPRQTITWNRKDKMLYADDTGLPYDWEKHETLEDAVEACDERWGSGDTAGIYEIKWAEGISA